MAAKKAKSTNSEEKAQKTVIARTDDGTLQITITIPEKAVGVARELALGHMIEGVEVPGFRKGKAPQDIALKHIDQQRLYEHTLQHLLPEFYARAIEEHSLRPIINAKFELVSIEEGKDWVVRAITCEAPEIKLGNYKKTIKENVGTPEIIVPGKEKKEQTPEEKENKIIETLLQSVEVTVPQVLIEEEVNHKLVQLLDQVQRLGLTVEQYLQSSGKTLEQIKQDYARQTEETLKLVMALNKIVEEEKIVVEDSEIEALMSTSAASGGQEMDERAKAEQRRLIKSVLLRRKALDTLSTLI